MTDAEYDYLFRDADPRWKAYYRMRREEYRKSHYRTNFDKWKEGLTLDETADKVSQLHLFCDFCPVNVAHECHYGSIGCRGSFTAWANAEAKEEE